MSWQKVKLGDILIRRKTSEKIHAEKTYKLVTIKLYHKGVTLRKEVKGDTLKSAMFAVKAGDFILSGIDARNGAFGIVPNELDGSVVTNDFWCLELNAKLIDKEFLLYLTTTDFFDYICKQSSDGTTQRIRLQKDKFFSYEIDLPSINEQKDILAKLQKLSKINHALLAEQASQFIHLSLLRQQILSDAIQDKLDIPHANGESGEDLLIRIKTEKAKTTNKAKPLPEIKDPDIPFAIPEHWTWCRLGDIFKFIDYRGKTPVRTDTGVRLISAKNIKMGYIDNNPIEYIDENHYDSWMVRGFPKNGDLLFVTEGHTMGFVAQIDLDFKYILAQRTICLQPYSYDYSSFTKYLIMSEPIQRKIKSMATGAAATGVKSSKLKELVIPLPPLSEQIAIVSKIESLMALCNKLEVNIRQNQEYTQMLYQTALREALQQPA